MLCRAHTALTDVPSASRRIPIICSSLNRLLFIASAASFSHQPSSNVTSTFPESGQPNPCLFNVIQHHLGCSQDGIARFCIFNQIASLPDCDAFTTVIDCHQGNW